jgi:hypothetical protein
MGSKGRRPGEKDSRPTTLALAPPAVVPMTELEHQQVVRILAGMIGDSQSRQRLRRRAIEAASDEEQAGGINLNGPQES